MTNAAFNWWFIIENYTEEDIIKIESINYNYLIYGKETNGDNQNVQGYIQLLSRKRLTGVKKLLKTAHWTIAKGSVEDNQNNCRKNEIVIEKGIASTRVVEKGVAKQRKKKVCKDKISIDKVQPLLSIPLPQKKRPKKEKYILTIPSLQKSF